MRPFVLIGKAIAQSGFTPGESLPIIAALGGARIAGLEFSLPFKSGAI